MLVRISPLLSYSKKSKEKIHSQSEQEPILDLGQCVKPVTLYPLTPNLASSMDIFIPEYNYSEKLWFDSGNCLGNFNYNYHD